MAKRTEKILYTLLFEDKKERIPLVIRHKTGLTRKEIKPDIKKRIYPHVKGFFIGQDVTKDELLKVIETGEYPI